MPEKSGFPSAVLGIDVVDDDEREQDALAKESARIQKKTANRVRKSMLHCNSGRFRRGLVHWMFQRGDRRGVEGSDDSQQSLSVAQRRPLAGDTHSSATGTTSAR